MKIMLNSSQEKELSSQETLPYHDHHHIFDHIQYDSLSIPTLSLFRSLLNKSETFLVHFQLLHIGRSTLTDIYAKVRQEKNCNQIVGEM